MAPVVKVIRGVAAAVILAAAGWELYSGSPAVFAMLTGMAVIVGLPAVTGKGG